MRVFITGATGFVGSSLVERWEHNHEVGCYQRGESVGAALTAFAPNAIVNCAAEIYDPALMFAANVELLRDVLEYALAHPAVKVVHLGSSSEYGPSCQATAETFPLRPVDMYQATKGAATLLCQGYARHHGLDVCIARPYSVYGPNERSHRLFPRLVRAFCDGEAMTLFEGFHDFIHMDDFGRGIDLLFASGRQTGEVYNFGSGVQTSNMEVLHLFEQAAGRSAPSVERKEAFAKAFESNLWVCDTSHSCKTLGFETQITLADGIRALLQRANR